MISIVIPTYNRAHLISRVLDNLLTQTCPNWQCIVVDDHSTDNSAAVIQQYVAKDSRFIYLLNNRRKGAQGARNTGVLAAQGDWICFFDSDDIMYPNYIERMQKEIEKGGADVIACYANARNVQTEAIEWVLDKINVRNLHRELLTEKSYVAYDVCVIRKQKLLDMGLLDELCPSMQEWDTHIRLSTIATYQVLPEVLCDWMTCGEDMITSNNQKHIDGLAYIYTKYRRDFRKYAYRHYLSALSQLWPDYPNHIQLLRLAPELLIYKPIKSFLKNDKS